MRLAILLLAATATAMEATPQLVIDGWWQPALLGAVGSRTAGLRHFDSIHLVASKVGLTLAPSQLPGMLPASYTQDPNVVAGFADSCRKAGRPWGAMVDLLAHRGGQRPESLALEENRSLKADTSIGAEWPYLSPWFPSVRHHLAGLLDEWAAWPTPPERLTLGLHLSRETILGYSEPARGAYIRDKARDPVDLVTSDEFGQWAAWREEQLARFLRELVDGYLAKRPRTRITAWGTGDLPIRDAKQRCASADNWLLWLEQGLVQEVVLDTTWEPARTKQIWDLLRQLSLARLKATGKSFLGTAQEPLAKLRPLVQHVAAPPRAWAFDPAKPPAEPKAWTIAEQVASLKAAGAPVENAVFYPHSVEELDEVIKLVDTARAGVTTGAAGDRR